MRAGLFDFLSPKKASPKGDALADELLQVCSSKSRDRIQELVSRSDGTGMPCHRTCPIGHCMQAGELQQYRVGNAASSPLLWGSWEVRLRCAVPVLDCWRVEDLIPGQQVAYASAPPGIGGAVTALLGLGKKQTTTFEKPDLIINEASLACGRPSGAAVDSEQAGMYPPAWSCR